MKFGNDITRAGISQNPLVKSPTGVLAALAMVLLVGCQTASLEDAAPKSVPNSSTQAAADTTKPAEPTKTGIAVLSPIPLPFNRPDKVERKDFVSTGIASGGKFPNLGTERTAALPQLSAAEASAMKQEFQALQQKGPNGNETEAAYRRRMAELRKLAKTHASDAEAEITK